MCQRKYLPISFAKLPLALTQLPMQENRSAKSAKNKTEIKKGRMKGRMKGKVEEEVESELVQVVSENKVSV